MDARETLAVEYDRPSAKEERWYLRPPFGPEITVARCDTYPVVAIDTSAWGSEDRLSHDDEGHPYMTVQLNREALYSRRPAIRPVTTNLLRAETAPREYELVYEGAKGGPETWQFRPRADGGSGPVDMPRVEFSQRQGVWTIAVAMPGPALGQRLVSYPTPYPTIAVWLNGATLYEREQSCHMRLPACCQWRRAGYPATDHE